MLGFVVTQMMPVAGNIVIVNGTDEKSLTKVQVKVIDAAVVAAKNELNAEDSGSNISDPDALVAVPVPVVAANDATPPLTNDEVGTLAVVGGEVADVFLVKEPETKKSKAE